MAPFVFVLALSMGREGIEDIDRHKNDKEQNSSGSTRIEDSKEKKITWADIEVGDILKIYEDEPFPTDLLLLSSNYDSGVCYIETGALDGEKNLKPKGAVSETCELFKGGVLPETHKVECYAEAPNAALYVFNGNLKV